MRREREPVFEVWVITEGLDERGQGRCGLTCTRLRPGIEQALAMADAVVGKVLGFEIIRQQARWRWVVQRIWRNFRADLAQNSSSPPEGSE